MKFELHRSIRWGSPDNSNRAYFAAVSGYYRHLSRLDFSGNRQLLRYFGDSFFHDARVTAAHWDPTASALELRIFTLHDLEDLNAYRRRKGLRAVPRARYTKKPVVYVCRFTVVNNAPNPIARLRHCFTRALILDTELDQRQPRGEFVVRISLGRTRELAFTCTGCTVQLEDRSRVLVYTDGLRTQMPRCVLCRSKLLSPATILQGLRDAEQALGEPNDRMERTVPLACLLT